MHDKTIELGKIQELELTADRSVVGASLLVWLLFALFGMRVVRLRPGPAIVGGLVATGLHFFSELWHQLGHARAARQAGYPMQGVHFWAALGTSVYPHDEPHLPAEVHVRRALGGPRASLLLSILGLVLAVVTWPARSVLSMITMLFALDNILVFTAGAFLPVPGMETDGTVLRKYGRRRHRNNFVWQE